MRFETANGNAMSARQAWHDAYVTGIKAIDYAELANGAGVQYTTKGSDNCTMHHCDKGKVQQVIHTLKMTERNAWAWGMFAYAPDGTETASMLLNILFRFAMQSVKTDSFNPFLSVECGRLAFIAVNDAAKEGRTGIRGRRKWDEMAAYCRCSVDDYKDKWMPIFFKMKDSVRDLDAVALPPVASLVWTLIDKSNGELSAAQDLQKTLKTASEAA